MGILADIFVAAPEDAASYAELVLGGEPGGISTSSGGGAVASPNPSTCTGTLAEPQRGLERRPDTVVDRLLANGLGLDRGTTTVSKSRGITCLACRGA